MCRMFLVCLTKPIGYKCKLQAQTPQQTYLIPHIMCQRVVYLPPKLHQPIPKKTTLQSDKHLYCVNTQARWIIAKLAYTFKRKHMNIQPAAYANYTYMLPVQCCAYKQLFLTLNIIVIIIKIVTFCRKKNTMWCTLFEAQQVD